MKNKLNLIIDFNNLLLRSVSLPGLSYSNSTFDKDEDVYDLLKKVTIDICFNIRLFNPTNVSLYSSTIILAKVTMEFSGKLSSIEYLIARLINLLKT